MSLEQQIADAIVIAFDELGGNPHDAVRNALYRRTTQEWINDETTKIALAGGIEMLIPGIQVLTIPAGISYLMHKMAHIAWGIGALKGAYIVETAHYSDLRNILTLYANSGQYNASLLDFQAISVEAYTYALSPEGYQHLQTLTTDQQRVDTTATTWGVLKSLAQEYHDDERAQQLLKSLAGSKVSQKALNDTEGRVTLADDVVVNEMIERRMGAKLALKLATQISARVPAQFVMGFVPVAGAIVNAFFNAQTLKSMADSAEKYYSNTITKKDIAPL